MPTGLTSEEASERLLQYGENKLPCHPPPSILAIFLHQFASPLIYILLFAAVVSLAIGELADAGFIVIVLTINGLIGTAQERSAAQAMQKLLVEQAYQSRVLRDGEWCSVNAQDVVPDDVILLRAGDSIPADIVWDEVTNVECDESVFSGESSPVQKNADDKSFAGTFVIKGRGRGVVSATGSQSELGLLSKVIGEKSLLDPPLVIRIKRFANHIGIILGIGVILLMLYGSARGHSIRELFLISVGLAVSAIPEGLPVAMSVALAVASRRMARNNVLIRKPPATEALGSCTVIATDKTGTLTENKMKLRSIVLPDGREVSVPYGAVKDSTVSPEEALIKQEIVRLGLLAAGLDCERADPSEDALDRALLETGEVLELDICNDLSGWTLREVRAFDSIQRFSAALYKRNGESWIIVKGAVEEVLAMCSHAYSLKEFRPDTIYDLNRDLTKQGSRVLGVAEARSVLSLTLEGALSNSELNFRALLDFQDPLRPEVPEAVSLCGGADVRIVIITGDDPRTAASVAVQAGIISSQDEGVVTGQDLERAVKEGGENALDSIVRDNTIFARVSPFQKLEIVRSLDRQNHFVAVTGDGINDTPALKHAHVGIAMGKRGADVAKESADIVLADDNFASIVAGIREGRVVYSNVRKVVFMLVSTGCGEVVLFLLSIAAGLPMPLTPAQLLWLNLVTEGVQDIALAFEKAEGDELQRKPRNPREEIFDSLMRRRVFVTALVMGFLSFLVFSTTYRESQDLTYARAVVLTLFVVFENIQALHARSERRSLLSIPFFSNPWLLMGIGLAQGIHLLALLYPQALPVLDLTAVVGTDWLLIGVCAVVVCVAIEADKFFTRRIADGGEAVRPANVSM